MADDIRKKILMGSKYESTVKLSAYGGAEITIRALPDMKITQIEDRVGGVTTLDVIKATQDAAKIYEEKATKAKTESEKLAVEVEAAKLLTSKMKQFLAEVCKAGIVLDPDPECKTCNGKDANCAECGVAVLVDNFRGSTAIEIGVQILMMSMSDWKTVEDFFSAQKGQAGAE